MSASLINNNVTMEHSKKEAIRGALENLLLKIKSPYIVTPYAQDFHDLCCKVAIERGYPMGTDRSVPSLLPFIPSGVIMAAIAYAHIEDEATRVFISLYTAFLVYVDDAFERNIERISVFIERFVRKEKQLDPVLDGLASFLLSIPDHYEPVVASIEINGGGDVSWQTNERYMHETSIILTATLNLINASTLEFQTQGMKASLHAKEYPEFTRRLSGSSETYALMAFPRSVPMQNYIQCIPEAANFIGHGNDVLALYKEELAGDTVNYISVLARCHGLQKMGAFVKLTNNVADANEQVCKILEADQEAYRAWQKFKVGYVGFHTSFDRYLLDDLMN